MRPLGVTLVGIYQILRGLMGLVFGLFILFFVGPANKFASVASRGNSVERVVGHMGHAAGLVVILFAIVHVIASYGVLLIRNWGRLLTILFSAIELALVISKDVGVNVFSLLVGGLNAACIFYLAMPPVRRAFQTERTRAHVAG
jgi:hypothetical protein